GEWGGANRLRGGHPGTIRGSFPGPDRRPGGIGREGRFGWEKWLQRPRIGCQPCSQALVPRCFRAIWQIPLKTLPSRSVFVRILLPWGSVKVKKRILFGCQKKGSVGAQATTGSDRRHVMKR